jgi:hypothetical protein
LDDQIDINNIYFVGPQGNYTYTRPQSYSINYPVKYPPVTDVILPYTFTDQLYGNGLYYEIYSQCESSKFGTYTITGSNGSFSIVFPTPLKVTKYSLNSTSSWRLSATNDDIFVYTLDTQQENVSTTTYDINPFTEFSKYTFTFDSPGQVTGLMYYALSVFEPTGNVTSSVVYPDVTIVARTNSRLFSDIFTQIPNVTTPYITLKYSNTFLKIYDEFSLVYSEQLTDYPAIYTDTIQADEYIIYNGILDDNKTTSLVRYLKLKWEA